MRRSLISATLALLAPAACPAADMLRGPVEADVVRVIDGDTFIAEARIWPGQTLTVGVRIRGIDAPELRSSCAAERRAAEASRAALEELLGSGGVLISNVGGGKYYGRVMADVMAGDGRAVGAALVDRALARPYDGGRRADYCG